MRFLLTLLVVCLLAAAVHSKFVQVDTTTQNFVDDHGRTRIFHGINAVYKVFPYYPPYLNRFDANSSLCDEDFANLKSWGMNVIRLYLSWQGAETVQGKYNDTYLDVLQSIVQRAAKYNIFIILDVHQDLASPKYCGEGFPDWAATVDPNPQHPGAFPFPLLIKLQFDNQTGYPLISDCTKHPFFEYYLSMDVGRAFQNLYSNVNGIRDHFAAFWQHVAQRFQNETNLLGYEILNEPFAGDIFAHPSLLVEGGKADRENLAPLYKHVHDMVRQVDDNHILFYEPMVSDLQTVGLPVNGPGGAAYNNRQAFSYHIYCSVNDPHGDPRSHTVCQLEDDTFFNWRDASVKQQATGRFLTEFGAVSDKPIAISEISWVLDQADKRQLSWAYWQFKYYSDITTAARPGTIESLYTVDGQLQMSKVKALSRTYAPAICGNPIVTFFDTTDAYFKLQYTAVNCQNQPTEIYMHQPFYYPHGFTVQVQPQDAATVQQVDDHTLYVHHAQQVQPGQVILVQIYAK